MLLPDLLGVSGNLVFLSSEIQHYEICLQPHTAFSLCLSVSKFPPFIKTSVVLDFMTSFSLDYPYKDLLSK